MPSARNALDESFRASLQHIALLRHREARLAAAREDTQAQVLHMIGSAYRCGEIDDERLQELFEATKAARIPLSSWDEHVPVTWRQMIQAERRRHLEALHAPNGPEGSWIGPWPLGDADPRPKGGQSVVYVLFDADNEPCYVGSTKNFRSRLGQHAKDGKEFARWQAHPCHDREHAYALEDRLLRERLPRLNRKASR